MTPRRWTTSTSSSASSRRLASCRSLRKTLSPEPSPRFSRKDDSGGAALGQKTASLFDKGGES
nr:MAG TPA: hypothetical protein [Caudoviricetes sp.]